MCILNVKGVGRWEEGGGLWVYNECVHNVQKL